MSRTALHSPRHVRAITAMTALLMTAVSGTAVAQGASARGLSLYSASDVEAPKDPNGFLLNPRWRYGGVRPDVEKECRFRARVGELERRSLVMTREHCLSSDERPLVTLNESVATLGYGLVCGTSSSTGGLRGHVNWFPVTASGRLLWAGYSKAPGDQDLTLNLVTPAPNLATTGNDVSGYHLEFFYPETLRRLPTDGQTYWHALQRFIDNGSRKAIADSLLTNRFAIATGLFNLDAVHGFHAELHPVYALSILLDTVRVDRRTVRERWAIMVRNLGNQGDCGQGRLPMFTSAPSAVRSDAGRIAQDFAVDLGWWGPAISATVRIEDAWGTRANHQVWFSADSAKRVLFGVQHPVPLRGAPNFLYLATVAVDWTVMGDESRPTDRFAGAVDDAGLLRINTLGSDKLRVALAGAPGRDTTGPGLLVHLPNTELAKRLVTGARPTLAYRAETWIAEDTIGFERCIKRRSLSIVCTSRLRLALFPVSWDRWTSHVYGPRNDELATPASLGLLLAAHSWRWTWGPHWIAGLSDGLSRLSYRFEVRRDSYVRDRPPALRGFSGRVVPILSAGSWHPRENTTLTPYGLAGLGWSFAGRREERSSYGPLWQTGSGLEFHHPGLNVFIELSRVERWHVKGANNLTLGFLFPYPSANSP